MKKFGKMIEASIKSASIYSSMLFYTLVYILMIASFTLPILFVLNIISFSIIIWVAKFYLCGVIAFIGLMLFIGLSAFLLTKMLIDNTKELN